MNASRCCFRALRHPPRFGCRKIVPPRSYCSERPLWVSAMPIILAACVCLGHVPETQAQGIRRLARSPLAMRSNQIFDDAAYLSAQGDSLVSAAVARNLNADAASKEMENLLKSDQIYFERRKLNREAREAEHPGYLERLEIRKKQYRRIIDRDLAAQRGDLSGLLNWMLRDLQANTSPSIFMSDHPGSLINSEDNDDLSDDERSQILVCEGNTAGKQGFKFRIDTAERDARWPMLLREDRFAAVRKVFERALDTAVGNLQDDKEVALASQKQLWDALDGLKAELAAYGRELPKPLSPHDGLPYVNAKEHVLSLKSSIRRLIETRSAAAFDGSFGFQGKSVGELVQHMMGKGLEFAKAEPGGEAAYRRVYVCLRAFYLRLVPEPMDNGR